MNKTKGPAQSTALSHRCPREGEREREREIKRATKVQGLSPAQPPIHARRTYRCRRGTLGAGMDVGAAGGRTPGSRSQTRSPRRRSLRDALAHRPAGSHLPGSSFVRQRNIRYVGRARFPLHQRSKRRSGDCNNSSDSIGKNNNSNESSNNYLTSKNPNQLEQKRRR